MHDAKTLLRKAGAIIAGAEVEHREMTDAECARCDALIDAALALARLAKADEPAFTPGLRAAPDVVGKQLAGVF